MDETRSCVAALSSCSLLFSPPSNDQFGGGGASDKILPQPFQACRAGQFALMIGDSSDQRWVLVLNQTYGFEPEELED